MASPQSAGSSIIQSLLEGVNSGIEESRLKKKKKKEFAETSNLLLDQKMKENQALFDQKLKQSEQALPSKMAELKQVSDFNFNQAQEQKKKKREALVGKLGQDGKYSGGSLSDLLNNNPRRAQAIIAAMDGIQIPMPARQDIAALTSQGKYQEAWNASDDPIDRQHVLKAVEFHNAITKGQNNEVMSALQTGGVDAALGAAKTKKDIDTINAFKRAKGGTSSSKTPSSVINPSTKADAEEIRRLDKLAETYKDEANDLNGNEEEKNAAKEELKKINAQKRALLNKKDKPAPIRSRDESVKKVSTIVETLGKLMNDYRKGAK